MKVSASKTSADISTRRGFFHIFGICVGNTTLNHTIAVIRNLIRRDCRSYICVSNTHVIVTAVRNRFYRHVINRADWNLPDGMPLVWYARKCLGIKRLERVTGPSLMVRCFGELTEAKHYFYGSTPKTLKKIEDLLSKRFPDLNVVGANAPPFRSLTPNERRGIISEINKLGPDVIWVALGAPKQEIFMYQVRNEIQKGVMIGVGAAFDYFAGNIKRPPKWLRKSGFEWLGRLLHEPGRLGTRYFINNCLFIFYMAREVLFSRNHNKIKDQSIH